MSRPNLVHPDQPLPLRWLLHVYQTAASLKLAVLLILWLAFTLGVGTFVEAAFGTPVAQYCVYQTWWFNLLLILLAVNIFCAASIRYPWKRHQTGFVITHIGLLTLLLGTALSRKYGIDAQIFVWEYATQSYAMEEDMHLRMYVLDDPEMPDAQVRGLAAGAAPPGKALRPIAYQPGPFSFRDYREVLRFPTSWMFSAARKAHAGDVIYNRDGIKVEVLDYFADLRKVRAPQITVKVSTPRQDRLDEDGKTVKSRHHWVTDTIQIVEVDEGGQDYPFGENKTKGMFAGGTLSFMMTDQPGRLAAFQACSPKGPLGEKGQAVVYAGGKLLRINVAEKLGQGRLPIDGTPWEVEVANYWPAAQPQFDRTTKQIEAVSPGDITNSIAPCVQLSLFRDGQPAGRLLLFSEEPGRSIQNYEHNVYGDYWFDHTSKDKDERRMYALGNRIDILQMKVDPTKRDKSAYKLYYRRWDKSSVSAAGEISPQGTPDMALDAFTMGDQLKFFVHEHVGADKPQETMLPVKFVKDRRIGIREPALKLRVTVDDVVEERWLSASKSNPNFLPMDEESHLVVGSEKRKVSLMLPINSVDVGFRVKLHDFDRRLDPGTSQPSHYSSTVSFWDRFVDSKVMQASVESGRVGQVEMPVLLESDEPLRADKIAATSDGKFLFWIDEQARSIYRIERDSPKNLPVVILDGRKEREPVIPTALAVDNDADQLYWVEAAIRGHFAQVRRANLVGKNKESLVLFSGKPTGLAIDPANEIVFWCYRKLNPEDGKSNGVVGRIDFDRQNKQLELLTRKSPLTSIAVDPLTERIYWTEPTAIRRANYDGGRVERITPAGDDVGGEQRPASVAVDGKSKRLYWADLYEPEKSAAAHETARPSTERHRIFTAGLDGQDAHILAGRRVDNPRSLIVAPDGDGVWWTQDAVFKSDVWITMNAPVEYANPRSGQSYRLFQENFDGPYTPGSRQYETLVPKNVDADDLYASVLTVNYDPGRWIRNIGCLFIVCGIATMFYMRAYFFRPRRHVEAEQRAEVAPTTTAQAAVNGNAASGNPPRKSKTPDEVAQ